VGICKAGRKKNRKLELHQLIVHQVYHLVSKTTAKDESLPHRE
jgi:hypothetical protein